MNPRNKIAMSLLAVVGLLISVQAGAGEITPKTQAIPTPLQVGWQDLELGMFIHFAPNTWQDQEYDDHTTPLNEINPTDLNTDQWVDAALAMGARYIVFGAKHVGGFCMWQTNTSPYGIKQTPWKDGNGDVVADLAASCKKKGIKLGVYLSPRDDMFGADTGGRCPTPEQQAAYNAVYRQQLTEVLNPNWEIMEVWFDGGNIIEVGDILAAMASNAVIFQGKYASIRWVGNEDGIAPYPAWNAVWETQRLTGGATAADSDPNGDAWLPIECDARIRSTWFWNSKNADTLKSVDQLMDMYYQSVGHGTSLLLNMTPDTTGRIPVTDVQRAAEFGREVQRRFGRPVAETEGVGESVTLQLVTPVTIDHIITMENLSQGECVLEYTLEVQTNGIWKEIVHGTAIGHKKIDKFVPVEATAVRLNCVQHNGTPNIRKLAAYNITSQCSYYKDLFDQQWDDLKAHLSLGPEPMDVDGDGLPEQWALRLVALILCDARSPYQLVHDEVYGAYMQNLLELEQEAPSIQPYKEVLAALLLMGADLRHEFVTRLGLTGSYTVFSQGKTNGKSPNEPFSGAGDIDGDDITNADEYGAVVSGGGSIDTFAQVALYWPGAGPLPVAGIVGLGALASVMALAGAHRVRRRARRIA